ncbi:MAG: phospholipase [Citrobacter freundii]|nr:MAG: phospholipase [Citrobacter freundii]
MLKNIFLFICLTFSAILNAQNRGLYEKFQFIQNGDTLPYRILLPENYDSSKAYPLVLFLHGRGESGNDNEKQLSLGSALFLRDSIRQKYPAIVVFPQCAANSYWSNVHTVADAKGHRTFYFVPDGEASSSMKLLLSFTSNLEVRYKIRKDQIYVMGLSMGGMGTFEIVRRKPGYFAAAVAICGGADPATALAMKKTKWWIFHGGKDDVVSPEFSEKMQAALKKAGATVRYTVYPEANHNSWDAAFKEPELLKWMFSVHRF